MKALPRRRRAVLLNSLLALGLLAGVGAAYAAVGPGGSGTKSTASTTTATVQRGTVLATVSGSGSLISPSDAGDSFVTGGTVTAVRVQAGDKVTKGEVLAEVDPTTADATLAQAQAALVSAQATLASAEAGTTTTVSSGGSTGGSGGSTGAGAGSGSAAGSTGKAAAATTTPATAAATTTTTTTVSASAVAAAKAQVTQDQAAVTAAQSAVAGTVLYAGTAGTVASVSNKVGDTVSGSSSGSGGSSSGGSSAGSGSSSSSDSSTPTGFVVITNPTGMEVQADFSETDALKLVQGQGASVILNANNATLDAKVVSVSSLPVSSSSTGSSSSAVEYEATLAITSDTSALRTGLSATVSVDTGVAENALYLPTAAVNGTGTTRTVTVVEANGSTQTQSVTVGIEGTSGIQIVSGLTLGQKVVLTVVSAGGSNGFPSGAFPGGAGGGRAGGGGVGSGLTGGGRG